MSISGILSNANNPYQLASSSNSYQQQMQQLSQDLQSGNLTAAQSDFATLQQAFSAPSTTTSTPSTSTSSSVAQAFNQLGSDLKSGNLQAAQKDFSSVQQDIQTNASIAFNHFRHSGHFSGSASSSQNSLFQSLGQIGQNSSATSLPAAQQSYAALQQQFQQFALGGGSLSSTQASALLDQSAVSVLA